MKSLILTLCAAGTLAGYAAEQAKTNPAPPVVDVAPRQRQEGRLEQRRPEPIDKEKQEKLTELGRKMRQEQSAVYDSMRKVRQELEALCKASPIDEKAVRSKASELGKLEGDAAMIRARHFQEVGKLLPKEQFERLQQVPPELRNLHTNNLQRSTNQALRLQSVVTNRPSATRPPNAPPARPATGQRAE